MFEVTRQDTNLGKYSLSLRLLYLIPNLVTCLQLLQSFALIGRAYTRVFMRITKEHKHIVALCSLLTLCNIFRKRILLYLTLLLIFSYIQYQLYYNTMTP